MFSYYLFNISFLLGSVLLNLLFEFSQCAFILNFSRFELFQVIHFDLHLSYLLIDHLFLLILLLGCKIHIGLPIMFVLLSGILKCVPQQLEIVLEICQFFLLYFDCFFYFKRIFHLTTCLGTYLSFALTISDSTLVFWYILNHKKCRYK